MDEKIGRHIGNYEITERLGQGASSEVYLARHTVLTDRIGAIKFLYATFDQTQQEQFVEEARVLEKLKHPHILPIYEVGILEDCAFLITEYASGGSLRDYIERSAPARMSTELIMTILLQTCEALWHAHKYNIVHRDVKPENILLNNAGDVLLADFGIAVTLEPECSEAKLDAVGTPAYLAPERLAGKITKAGDQYALGCIAYELFTGHKPFMADNVLEMLRKQREEMPLPLRQLAPELPPALEPVILRALAKERKQRFANIIDFAVALKTAINSTLTDPPKVLPELATKAPASTVLLQASITSYEEMKDFFVTYHNTDRFWAEWIAWQLEEAGYKTIVPAWDFHVGTDIQAEMHKATAKAKRIITVLSPDYFAIHKNLEEWHATFRQPVANGYERLIPVLVRKCENRHMKFLYSRVYIDLVECDEAVARQLLLARVQHKRVKPPLPPPFPGKKPEPPFPAPLSVGDQAQFTDQMIPLIRTAFARKDWSEVLQKTSPLLNPKDTHTLSSELFYVHGMALYHVGEVERASTELETALALETNEEKQLTLLKDYTNILKELNRWNEVYNRADKILQRLPSGDPYWQALRQEAHDHIAAPTIRALKVEIFFSYAHEDLALRNEIDRYLINLKRRNNIVGWYDGEISAGGEWNREIEEHLNYAQIILLLVSQAFIASHYCYEKEMKRALERHEAGEARVVPIILRSSDWEETPFGKLQALPTGGKPISRWRDRDEALLDVVRGIQKVVDEFTKPSI